MTASRILAGLVPAILLVCNCHTDSHGQPPVPHAHRERPKNPPPVDPDDEKAVRRAEAARRAAALPAWFKELDADGDGQISLFEWRLGGWKAEDFAAFDLNGDGFITADEVLPPPKGPTELKFERGRVAYTGAIEQAAAVVSHRGKVSFKFLLVSLDAGKTYHFEHASQAFQAFLYIEEATGEPIMENSSDTVGGVSKLVFRPTRTAKYRVVVTSAAGVRVGPFALTIRAEGKYDGMPEWFEELDADRDGQVSLFEWQRAGRMADDFAVLDPNGDGFITLDEMRDVQERKRELRLEKGRAAHAGTVEPTGERYRGKTSYKLLTVELEAGRTYHFDQISKMFQSMILLEDAGGEPLAESFARDIGSPCHLAYRATRTGTHRVVATSLGGYRTGPFTLTVRAESKYDPLPPWFEELDGNRDGQVSLFEWRAGNRPLDEFRTHDLDGDGHITIEEVLPKLKQLPEVKLEKGRGTFEGTVEEVTGRDYRGKVSYKFLTVALEAGKTYHFDLVSKAFQAFLYLETATGEPVAENSSSTVGGNSHLAYRVPKAGTYRIVATSAAGVRTGPFTLTVREETKYDPLPPWFEELDTDRDGQVSLFEWRKAGRKEEDFAALDANSDGLLTPEEVTPPAKEPEIKLERGRAVYRGTVESAPGGEHRGKVSYRVLAIELEAGKTYHFDHTTQSFTPFLFLETGSGEPLVENNSMAVGGNARIAYRATTTGTHRVVVTSGAGVRTGPFTLTVRTETRYDGLPLWFEKLDADRDGQVSLFEWRTGGRKVQDFAALDTSGDGLLTAEEVREQLEK